MTAPSGETLEQRLRRFPRDRYPVQHATTQFHRGAQLLHAGRVPDALDALQAASDGFATAGLTLERAKCAVMLGVALRLAGRLEEAAGACTDAAEALGSLGAPAEQAAALYNLGLVRQDTGRSVEACAAWSTAQELFVAAGHLDRAAAAARDAGAALLAGGDVAGARTLLEQSVALAEQADDQLGVGASANALGLACLAAHDVPAALDALRLARACFPARLRPAEFAMATANLALGYEQAGSSARARLLARQALAVPATAGPVRAQARALLERSPGSRAQDLVTALTDEPLDHAAEVLREQLLGLDEPSTPLRREVIQAVVAGLTGAPERSYDLGESMLSVLLEQPPELYDELITALVQVTGALPPEGGERVQAVVASALARFAMPQWQRTVAALNDAARAHGQPETWR